MNGFPWKPIKRFLKENMHYKIEEKPDPSVCPQKFCFCWRMGKVITAKHPEPPTVAQGCRSPFGVCTRLDPVNGDHDWYEPHEPNLREAGLPWFYFIVSPDGLTPTSKARYIVESEAMWRQERWKAPKPK